MLKLNSWLKNLFLKTKSKNSEWDNIVVGKILNVGKHPNADRLKVCTVDCGTETRTIVCGGSNVETGMLVVVAKPGAKVHFGGGAELEEIKETNIRGVNSEGMMCGADELGLAERFPIKQEREIINLNNLNVKVGSSFAGVINVK